MPLPVSPLCSLALLLLTAACAPSPVHTKPAAAPPFEPTIDARLQPIAWLSGGIRDLGYSRADRSAILTFLGRSPVPLPPCVQELRPSVDRQYMVTMLGGGSAVNLFFGRLNRERIEACIVAFWAGLRGPLTLVRQGPLSELATPEGQRSYLGWTADGWLIWHGERERVLQFLQRKGGLIAQAELAALLPQIDPSASHWAVSSADMTSRLLGVASQGYVMTMEDLPQPPGIAIRLLFARESDAQLAAAGIRSPRSELLSDAAKLAIASLRPQVIGSQLRLRIEPQLFEPAVVEELKRLLDQLPPGEAR